MDKAEKKRLASERKTAEKAAKAAAKEAKKAEKQKAAEEKKKAKEAAAAAKKAKKAGGSSTSLAPPVPIVGGNDGSATAAFKARPSQRVGAASKKGAASALASLGGGGFGGISPLQSMSEEEGADGAGSGAGAVIAAGDEDGLDDLGDAFELPADSQSAMPDQTNFLPPPAEVAGPALTPAPAATPAAAPAEQEQVSLYEMAGSSKTAAEIAAAAPPAPAEQEQVSLYEMAGSSKTAAEIAAAEAGDRKQAWENAADWLTAIGVLPKIDPEVLKTFDRPPNVYDFIVTLKSGVALCNALNVLVPGTTKPYPNPNKQFLRDKNIYKFLEGCGDIGVAEEELFLAEHLSEGSCIPAVVHTLAVISQMDVAVDKGFSPFEVPEDDGDVFADLYSNVEDVIQSFEEDQAMQEDASIYELAASGNDGSGLYGSYKAPTPPVFC